jgi:signal transduction histidine kinase
LRPMVRWAGLMVLALQLLLQCQLAAALATPAEVQLLGQARLTSLSGERQVSLPHRLDPQDFPDSGGSVRYRLDWHLQGVPQAPQAAYISKLSLSGRLYVNGDLVAECGSAPLADLRCLHQPQFFRIPVAVLRDGVNTLEFEIYATPRQMNGLSAVRVGQANVLYDSYYSWRQFLIVDLQVGLTWLSTMLGLLALTVGLILRRESVFLWFGLTSVVNAVASLNAVVSHPSIDIDVYNWMIFSSRLVSVPLSFLTLLAIFGKDHRRLVQVIVLYSVLAPIAIWFSDSNRTVAFSAYIPFVVACPFLLLLAIRWALKSRNPLQLISSAIMLILFSGGVLDWLRLGGRTQFEGVYFSVYSYAGMLVAIGLLLMVRLAAALLQSQRMEAVLEKQVAQRIAYEVTENIPIGTFTITISAPGAEPYFSFVSKRFLKLMGLDETYPDRKVIDILARVHPDDKDSFTRLYSRAFSERQAFSGRMRILANGQTRWVQIEFAPRARSDGSTVWEGVLIDETEQVLAREAAERDRAALQANLVEQSRQQEREQLLRDVHDGFGSQLASVRMMVERGHITPAALPDYLHELSADLYLVVGALGQTDVTLEEAIYDLRYRVERRFAGYDIRFHWHIDLQNVPAISSRTNLQILRIMQEALHNAIRHASAHHITLTAHYDKGQDVLSVCVCDDGGGIPDEPQRGRGLSNMTHRAREIGARLSVTSLTTGTSVDLRLENLSMRAVTSERAAESR